MSFKDLNLSLAVTTDLALLNRLSQPLLQIFLTQAFDFFSNRKATFDSSEFSEILADEGESVLSLKDIDSAKSAIKVFAATARQFSPEEVEIFLERRTGLTEETRGTLLSAMGEDRSALREVLKGSQLLSFDWTLKNELISGESSNLNELRVILTFVIAGQEGNKETRVLETSVTEALALKEEIGRIVDI